jgi:alkanesulfonate monooxygenase SsuD/methylene tetrahydromethanopterin reductase-like flavin-dependent oxidoreductase (luciferase family)
MRFGVTLPLFAEWADPRAVLELASDVEASGWDGFFVWDHVTWNPAWGGTPPMADPWISLAAAATVTARVVLGPIVTPLPRRRPQVVAREIVTLDHLSGGRALLGVGLGDDFEFEAFSEPVRARGRRLDESLTVLTSLMSGEPVDFDGEHLTVHSPPALPGPVSDHIPIWVGGHWPNRAPFERAARHDGVVPRKLGAETGAVLTIDDLREIQRLIGRSGNFDYVVSGLTDSPDDTKAVRRWKAAGATWWLEAIHPFGGAGPHMHDRVRRGPPRT